MATASKRSMRLIAIVVSLLAAAPTGAGAQVLVGVQDDPVFVRLPSAYGGLGTRGEISARLGYERLTQLGASALRVSVDWAAVEPRTRSREDWGHYDAAVASARRAGLAVQLVLAGPAPAFATGNRRVGNYRPSSSAFARFVEAAARRYRGQVSTYSIWNEPNWWSELKPNPLAPVLYRALYRAGYAAVKRIDPAAAVLMGELAPIGYQGAAIAPLRFLRELTCRTTSMRPSGRCPQLVADGFSVHPYTLRWSPSFPGKGADDVTTGSLSRLERILGRLAALHALSTPSGQAPPIYLTEYGWSPKYLRTESRRAAMTTAALAIVARHRQVREIVWYELAAPPPRHPWLWNTALLTHRGGLTPVFNALRAWIASGASSAGSKAGIRR
jgi:hypothetical protein